MNRPDKPTIASYIRGGLSDEEHKTVELWLDGQTEDMVSAVLEEASSETQIHKVYQSADAALNVNSLARYYFTPDLRKDRYQFVDKLGAGGMGIVELANDKTLVRKVAVKRSRPRGFNEDVTSFRQRQLLFQREAEIVGGLEHPGIIPIHEIGMDRYNNPAMIMKPLYGLDFEAWRNKCIEESGSIDLSAGIRVLLHVAEALAYAHAHAVVHRDVKVDNIVIGEHGEVTVIDWGLAVKIDKTQDGQDVREKESATGIFGTPSWMAPEQALGVAARPSMDVWAMGGLILFLFTGTDPRPDIESVAAITADAITAPIPLSKERLTGIPKGLRALIQRCLTEKADDRYQTCVEVADELRRWLKEGVTIAQRPGYHLRLLALIRRSPMWSAVLITIFCAGMAALITESLHFRNHQRQISGLATDLMERTNLNDLKEVTSARQQLLALQDRYGSITAMNEVDKQLEAAFVVLNHVRLLAEISSQLDALDKHFRETGPWITEIQDRSAALEKAGISWKSLGHDMALKLQSHALSDRLLANLAYIQVASLVHDKEHALHDHDDHAPINKFMSAVQLGKSWAALSEIFSLATVSAHEVILRDEMGVDVPRHLIDQCLDDKEVGDLLLALCQPDEDLMVYALNRVQGEPDAFWPRVVLARNAIVRKDLKNARLHALVALGREGQSVWPQLSLAYIELLSGNLVDAQRWVGNILNKHPEHLETRVLRAVIILESGNAKAAQAEIDEVAAWGHFHVHEESGGGHPMDIAIKMLKKKNIRLHGTH